MACLIVAVAINLSVLEDHTSSARFLCCIASVDKISTDKACCTVPLIAEFLVILNSSIIIIYVF